LNSIISVLVAYNQFLISQINLLLIIIAKNIPLRFPKYDITSPKYNKFSIDKLPVIMEPVKLEYKVLLKKYKADRGKSLKPVKSIGGNPVPSDICCERCGAPHIYLYDNDGGRGQFRCKLCGFRFNPKRKHAKQPITFHCPYCNAQLTKRIVRTEFIVHKCVSKKCPFYLDSLKKLSPGDLAEYQEEKSKFKLHYIYREFTTDFFKVDLDSMPKGSVNLRFRSFSPHVMGLCLTYHVNLSLSTRATARALWEVHQVKISHVMVSKYARSAAAIVKYFVDNYDYKPTNYLAADETYVKKKGIAQYVWFVMDALKKSILGYEVSDTRSTGHCILAMRRAFSKFKDFPGKALKFVVDGFTAYPLAQQQFALENKEFDITQVIGLTNDDPVSTEFRWLKQIIERLNRTFKFSYRVTNGYGSDEGSNTHVTLFVAYYNFLRPHTYSYWAPLNSIPELESISTMPGKWQKLIELSQKQILAKQTI